MCIMEKTYSIHHYSGSWLDWENRVFYNVKRKFAGNKFAQAIIKILFLPLRLKGKIRFLGIKNVYDLIVAKIGEKW